jgi:hypothetical protein
MFQRLLVLFLIAFGVLIFSMRGIETGARTPPPVFSFPSARDTPPPGWTGDVFVLSQDYPPTAPTPETLPWKAFDFKTQPIQYIDALLAYGLEGNIEVEFQVQKNAVRKWYHAPWMHQGREFIHGMTLERASRSKELAPTQTSQFQNWAVGFYNAPGGFVLGKVWANPDAPDPALARFPDGTVAFKLLFTAATEDQVPYLKNDFEWLTDINQVSKTGKPPVKLRLLQVDVAVRDTRNNNLTGWVFGTFIYDSNAPGATPFERLVPVGLMWGNDPSKVIGGGTLGQTFINPAQHIPQHLGFKGRLNGPVDNKVSSCLSCHSTATIPLDSHLGTINGVPPNNPTNAQLKSYFRNIKSGVPFAPGYASLDYSLQLQVGIAKFTKANPVAPPPPIGPHGPTIVGLATPTSATGRRSRIVIAPMERDGTPEQPVVRRRRRHGHY